MGFIALILGFVGGYYAGKHNLKVTFTNGINVTYVTSTGKVEKLF